MRIFNVLILALLSVSAISAQQSIKVGPEALIQGRSNGATIPLRDYVEDRNIINERVKAEKLGVTRRDWPIHPVVNINALPKDGDPALQTTYNKSSKVGNRAVNQNYDGMGYTSVNPADPSVDVSPNHVIQMINGSSGAYFKIWDKVGNVVVNQTYFDNFFNMPGGKGDPIVIYDQLADRWLVSEFANIGNHLHVAISQTADPTGAWNTYIYDTPSFPDYPKYSIWNDGYYVTTNENNSRIYAMDRDEMLNGNAGVMQEFDLANFPTIGFQAATPVSLDGMDLPPANSPAYFMRMADDAWSNNIPADRLEIFELEVDFDTPNNSTLSGSLNLSTEPFDTELCGYLSFSCIDQPNSNTNLDPLRELLMNKIIYRNFGTHESLVCNHVTDVDNTDHAGVRWYELRKSGSDDWSIYQQGTYSPDGDSRWMAGIGINAAGDIGLAYNVSGAATFPSIRYTGRRACDPLNTMSEPETVIVDGTAPNGSNRYGDYSTLSIDPTTDEFWFTGVYNSASQWSTRVAAFSLEACSPSVSFASSNSQLNEEDASVDNDCLDYIETQISIEIAQAPSQPVDITINTAGTATEGTTEDYIFFPSVVQLDANNLQETLTIRAYDDRVIEGEETAVLSFSLNANGGDGVAGTSRQSHEVTFVDNDIAPEDFSIDFEISLENFEAGLGDYNTQNPSGDTPFAVGSVADGATAAYNIPTTNSTEIVYVNDDACDCDMSNVSLTSPIYDFSSYSTLNLNFDVYFEDNTYQAINENAYIDVAVNGGAFVEIYEIPGLENSWQNLDLDLSAYAGNAQVQIRFRYEDGGGWLYGLAFDNIKFTTNLSLEIATSVSTSTPDIGYLGPNQSVYYYHPIDGRLLAKIDNTSSHDFGCVDDSINRAGTSFYNTLASVGDITDKNYLITPEFQSTTASYDVTLYYTLAELQPWISAENGGCELLADLMMIKGSASIEDETTSYESMVASNSLTFNGTDYDFKSSHLGSMGGFALADSKSDSRLFVSISGSDTNDGSDWTNSFATLQAAIDAIGNSSCPGGIEIRIGKGTYTPSKDNLGQTPSDNREKTFFLNQNITLRGGFAGTDGAADNDDITLRDFDVNETILSGDLLGDDTGNGGNIIDNSYHVVYLDGSGGPIIIDGLTIQGGNGTEGAGIYALNSATISDAIIENCTSANAGSAIFADGMNTLLTINILRTEFNNPEDIYATNGAEIQFFGEIEIKD